MLMLGRTTSLLLKLGAHLFEQLLQAISRLRRLGHASMRVVHGAGRCESRGLWVCCRGLWSCRERLRWLGKS